MAINTQDKLVAALAAGGNTYAILKPTIANLAAGQWFSTWRALGYPTQGAIPTAAAVCDDTLQGTIPLPSFGGLDCHLLASAMANSIIGQLFLADRLAHMGGLSGTVITAQTVNVAIATPASNGRCLASGADVHWGITVYTDMGSTSVNASVAYVDQDDNARTAPAISLGATPRAGRIYPIIPLAGTTIKSVTSVTLSATTGTAGNFGVTAWKLLATQGQNVAYAASMRDYATLGMPEIQESTCLEIIGVTSTTSSGQIVGLIEWGLG